MNSSMCDAKTDDKKTAMKRGTVSIKMKKSKKVNSIQSVWKAGQDV